MVEVEQELLVTKTVQEVEKVKDVNFIGLYITSEEKVNSIFNRKINIYKLNRTKLKNKKEKKISEKSHKRETDIFLIKFPEF